MKLHWAIAFAGLVAAHMIWHAIYVKAFVRIEYGEATLLLRSGLGALCTVTGLFGAILLVRFAPPHRIWVLLIAFLASLINFWLFAGSRESSYQTELIGGAFFSSVWFAACSRLIAGGLLDVLPLRPADYVILGVAPGGEARPKMLRLLAVCALFVLLQGLVLKRAI